MANGRFIVCNPAIANESNLAADACADCGTPIIIDGTRDATATHICEACLPARLASDAPDEVDVTVGAEAPKAPAGEPTQADMLACNDARDGACDCRWCQTVNPVADELAAVLKKHKARDKMVLVDAVARVLVEAAVVYQGGFGMWHRDGMRVSGLVQARAMRVADRERQAEAERMRPIVERALADAGIDVNDLFRDIPQEPTH